MATITQRGLGKGLSALIPDNYTSEPEVQAAKKKAAAKNVSSKTAENTVTKNVVKTGVKTAAKAGVKTPAVAGTALEGLHRVRTSQLRPGKYQPRSEFNDEAISELAASIEKNGIMQPIVVRIHGKDSNSFEIIAGERRWRAAQKAGLDEVPVLVRDIDDKHALELALVENIQRQDLTPIEEAYGYQRLIEEFEYTQEELSGVIGKSRSHVANLLRLLALPEQIRLMLEKSELTMGHARALIGVPGATELAHDIVKRGLNVRQVEKLVRERQGGGNARTQNKKVVSQTSGTIIPPSGPKDPDIIALEESLSENLGLKVSINDRGQNGEIILSYDSLSQLDGILRRLGDGF